MARVRISKTPKALSGLEIKMRPGLYGTNGNRQFSLPNQVNSQKFAEQPIDVRSTLQPVDREKANLEAEKGETAIVNIDGIPAHFKIGGKRHSEGGTPLNLPDNSFIFSDTAKMKIKDPIVLAQFGMVPKKSGYTPAEIAKKFDINTFRKILADPNSEDIERKTAESMISNYNMKLAKLALVQESMKGFPQGIPAVAMPYVIANDINPAELAETQGQEEQPDADMGVSRYGGIPRAQKGKAVQDSVRHQAEKTLLYEKGNPKNPNTGGGYDSNTGKAFGLADWGYHESQSVPANPNFAVPTTFKDAVQKYMDEVDPRNAEAFPNALTRGQANDFLFSTGRDIRPYVVDQMYKEKYGKKEGIPNRSQYNVDTKNVKDSKGKLKLPGKKEFTPEIKNRIDSLWNANLPQWNNLSYDDQQALMGLGRQSYGRAINRGPGEGNENLEQYNEVWHGRIPNLNSANYNNPVWWDQDNKRYGGNMIAQFNTKAYGGSPMAQTGRQVTPGFGDSFNTQPEGEFAKKYPGIYNAYMQALNSGKPEEMTKVADLIESQQTKQTPWYSLDVIPGTDADMFENLATVLKQNSKKIQNQSKYKPENIKNAYKDLPVKALGIYGKLKQQYDAIPDTDYMAKIDVDNKMKVIESLLPANKARYLSKAQKEPWQMYSKEDLGMINTMFDETFKPAPKTTVLVEKDKEKTKETAPVTTTTETSSTTPIEPVKPAATTKAKTTSTSSTGKKDLRTMTDAELEALLNE